MKKARLDYTFISPLNCKACKIKTIQQQEASKKRLQCIVLPDKKAYEIKKNLGSKHIKQI